MQGQDEYIKGVLKLCCTKGENLLPFERMGPDVGFRRCRECGCRHFEMSADPFYVGLDVTSI